MGEGIWVPPGGSADPRREREAPPQAPPELSPEEVAEQLRRLDVAELLLSLLPTLAQLAYAKLDPGTRDIAQARLAIEGMRVLVGVLEGAVPDEVVRDLRHVTGNLQLAYVKAAEEAAERPVRESGPVEGAPGGPRSGLSAKRTGGGVPGNREVPRAVPTDHKTPAEARDRTTSSPSRRRSNLPTAEIGVFGGSGFYSFLDDVEELEIDTPYGKPSAPLVVGEIGGKSVAFLPRHGRNHELPPHRIPYRANVWAMREIGVRRVIGPNASGALKAELELGEFVVCDQFVDRTTGRADTFYDGPETTHVSAADPYCPDLRRLLVETARELQIPVRDGGTVVAIQGPRFSTRAESRWFQDAGWDVINMTAYPEGCLARELELCYANVSMVTDHDVGVAGTEPVTHETVIKVFNENNERLRELLFAVVPKIAPQPEDVCATALRAARL